MENEELKLIAKILNDAAFFSSVLTLFDDKDSISKNDIEERVKFYSDKLDSMLKNI